MPTIRGIVKIINVRDIKEIFDADKKIHIILNMPNIDRMKWFLSLFVFKKYVSFNKNIIKIKSGIALLKNKIWKTLYPEFNNLIAAYIKEKLNDAIIA